MPAERSGLQRQREDADRVWPEVQTSTADVKGKGEGQKAKGKDVDHGGVVARRRGSTRERKVRGARGRPAGARVWNWQG